VPKSDRITVAARVHDVLRLILAGAEFGDVRQYASEHGWNISERQVRRYIEAAHKRFAKATRRDRTQLMGRHLMQRRALYARAIKASDLKTALQILRDEAELQGLYPAAKTTPTSPNGPFPGSYLSPLTRQERVVRLLAAEASNDRVQQLLLEQATPFLLYRLPDVAMPTHMLSVMALMYVAEQLEAAVMVVNAMFCQATGDDPDDFWEHVGLLSAYRFRIGQEAWQQFTERLGVDGEYLVRGNHQGHFLAEYRDKICALAPSGEETKALLTKMPQKSADALTTAEDLCRSWQRLFAEICRD
jgi:hypothetical protein